MASAILRNTLRAATKTSFKPTSIAFNNARRLASVAPFVKGEPEGPSIKTSEIPGPVAVEKIKTLDEIFDTRALNMLCDYEKSLGNYIVDADGNSYLDVYAQIASIPVGYNNPHLLAAVQSKQCLNYLINRPALGNFPPVDWESILRASVLSVAPPGLDQVFTALAGSDANETAYKAAFMYRRRIERGEGVDFTQAEMASSMLNEQPGSPQLSIMSFKRAFHGRLFGSLSTTRSKPIHKLDIPAFDWPQAPFPELKYPLSEHEAENRAEEDRCIEETERILKTFHHPVAAVVVEPVQSEGGDNHATPYFFQKLREITARNNVLLIVDEVQTGVGATGKFWAHEHWNLSSPPDLVTFSKKAQSGGYYYTNPLLRPNKPYRQFNTWMGDPSRVLLFRAILEEIQSKNLVENTKQTGDYLFNGLREMAKKYPGQIKDLRGEGQGTFIAWDTVNRDGFLKEMKYAGVNIGGSGETAVRLRPMLIFQKTHADILLNALESTWKKRS